MSPESSVVHVFFSTNRFGSFAELRAFIDPTYTEDGEAIPSRLMREIGISSFEPACIEAIVEANPLPLPELLDGVSYGEQWIHLVDAARVGNEAICVFAPNRVARPRSAQSVEYAGGFQYRSLSELRDVVFTLPARGQR